MLRRNVTTFCSGAADFYFVLRQRPRWRHTGIEIDESHE
jgi:hypothetical protein